MARHDRYNLVVIGAGAGGLVSAYIGAAVKARVALIERGKMGGDCLNYGCVPSKALIRTARFVAEMNRHQDLGIKSVSYELTFADVMARVHEKIKKIEPNDSVERYTGLGVECIQGEAELIDERTVRVGERTLRGKRIILALGASPLVPEIEGISNIPYLTSENLWEMQELPKQLVVLGGGPIGCELAQAFQRLGSQVTQVEMAPRLLLKEDRDVSEAVEARLKGEGVRVLTNVKARAVAKGTSGNALVCDGPDGEVKIPFDRLLLAVGRRPNTQNIDWQRLGIELEGNGALKVDEYLRTSNKRIYACGDVIGHYQFTHTASHQAWFCAVNALFSPLKKFKVDYRVIPWVTFTDPEVAHVGLNEEAAKAKGIPYEVTRYDVSDLDRAIVESEAHGFIKVLTKPKTDKIIGATIVSHAAGEMIGEFVAAMKHGFGLNKILGTIHAYPTFIEANKYVAGQWKKAHAPSWALKLLKGYHALRR